MDLFVKKFLGYKAVVLDVVTRWNSTVEMLQRAIYVSNQRDSEIKEISSEEWVYFEMFAELLTYFKRATEISMRLSLQRCRGITHYWRSAMI
jgi:hypothetical protein